MEESAENVILLSSVSRLLLSPCLGLRAMTHLVGIIHSEDVSLEFFRVRPRVTLLHHGVERFP